MKYLFAIIVSALALVAAGYEGMWHAGRLNLSESMMSQDGRYVAQLSLSEESAAPYGTGAYIRHRYVPFWSASRLVFAGYCDLNPRLYWRSSRELVIECKPVEGTPKLFPAQGNIVVIHVK